MYVLLIFCQTDLSASNLKISKQKEILRKELDSFKDLKQTLEHLLRKTEHQQVRNTKHYFNSDISRLKGILFLEIKILVYLKWK